MSGFIQQLPCFLSSSGAVHLASLSVIKLLKFAKDGPGYCSFYNKQKKHYKMGDDASSTAIYWFIITLLGNLERRRGKGSHWTPMRQCQWETVSAAGSNFSSKGQCFQSWMDADYIKDQVYPIISVELPVGVPTHLTSSVLLNHCQCALFVFSPWGILWKDNRWIRWDAVNYRLLNIETGKRCGTFAEV